MNRPEDRRFLDSIYARLLALACFALSVSALVYVHRDDLFPAPPDRAAARNDAFGRCFRDATASIDKMLSEKTINESQANLFRMRAEARCRAQAGTPAGPPSGAPPGLQPAR